MLGRQHALHLPSALTVAGRRSLSLYTCHAFGVIMRVVGVAVIERGAVSPKRLSSSFDEFYEQHYAAAVRLATALVGRRAVAEELVQDAFLALFQRWDRISLYESPEGWMRRVVVNRAVSSLRRRTVEARLVLRLGSRREEHAAPAERDLALWRGVAALPKRQAQAVVLTYVDGLGPAEIAEVLGCDESTVRTHLRRAHATLAAQVDDPGDER